MNDELMKSIVGATDESNKKKVMCQCAATLYATTNDINQAVDLAKQIVQKIYASV